MGTFGCLFFLDVSGNLLFLPFLHADDDCGENVACRLTCQLAFLSFPHFFSMSAADRLAPANYRLAAWAFLLACIAGCYWPGLHGMFVFDDDANILKNPALALNSLTFTGLWEAAWSSHAGPMGRPVAMFSFALNYIAADGHAVAFQFKLVNLVIHLLNTLLVGWLAQRLCEVYVERRVAFTVPSPRGGGEELLPWMGFITAALWGLHPMNLTGVLFVVQRMTSLSSLFGLAALAVYAQYRGRTWQTPGMKRPVLWGLSTAVAVAALYALSVLSKESGLLFAPLLFWVELCVYRFRFAGEPVRIGPVLLRNLALGAVGLTLLYVAVFKIPDMVVPEAFANRNFTMPERALTEGRVLLFYLRMLVAPRNDELGLYHDDFPLSHSLWSPPGTALALVFLVSITLLVSGLRRRVPELAFGWGWFLIAHALESTIFSLELVYEHRNYFALVGLLLLVPLQLGKIGALRSRWLAVGIVTAYAALLGFITFARSEQWSNPVDWAALEATNHPQSPRTNYELARVYMFAMAQANDQHYGDLADEALVQAMQAPGADALPAISRVHLAYIRGRIPDQSMIEDAQRTLAKPPFYNSTIAGLVALTDCQTSNVCKFPEETLHGIYDAALDNPAISNYARGEVLKVMANYWIGHRGDLLQGMNLIDQSLRINDAAPGRIMYAQAFRLGGQYTQALEQLDLAVNLDKERAYGQAIAKERAIINFMRQAQQPVPAPNKP